MRSKDRAIAISDRRVNSKRPVKMDQTEKLSRLLEALNAAQSQGFTRSIRINFSPASIGRVEKFEEILK